ncbi:MAG TPA: hypothetical protein VIV14_10765 [Gammaproteobacteria bacterium]
MSDQKTHQFRPALCDGVGNGRDTLTRAPRAATTANGSDRRISEQQGWEAYRKWLSHVNAQPKQRSSIDTSIYSWRGYNNWADKIRQTWKDDEAG